MNLHQILREAWTFLHRNYSNDSEAAAMGNWWLAASSRQGTHSHITSPASFLVKHQITQVTQPHYCPDTVPSKFWLFPKLKSPLKGKRVQTVDETQENTTGQLMAIARTVWGPKVTTLKGTKASLSYVQCFLYLVSSSIKVSIVHITWLDTFWTDLICVYIYVHTHICTYECFM